MPISSSLRGLIRNMSKKIHYPATHRNKEPILSVLQKYISVDTPGNILEISSGTGQHASFFAEYFPKLTFYTSEFEMSLFDSISAYAKDVKTKNVKDPIYIDVTKPFNSWCLSEQSFEFILNVNMIHISPYTCTVGLFENSSKLLKDGGLLFTYGPYANEGIITPQSNVNFDQNLRSENPEWGLRDIQDLKVLAGQNKIQLLEINDLPANNKCLVWIK